MRDFPPADPKAEEAALQTLFFQDSEFEGKACRLSVANYLAFMSLRGPQAQAEIDKLRRAIAEPTQAHLERDLALLLRARDWRFHNIACVAIACRRVSDPVLSELWRCIRAGSWASPQLCATAAHVDPDFQEKAASLLEDRATYYKSISALAALLAETAPHAALSQTAIVNIEEAAAIDFGGSGVIAGRWRRSLAEAFSGGAAMAPSAESNISGDSIPPTSA
ncbi:hypothetical protein [Lysobacter sp. cf310]|uniref:hypothetical protein n=1 Tax=Lysobacter sp. cf310 TaxID=1761790 RepID=UPI0008E19199|nr:hypothetical protein [Lysobacter sp. cf310]SFL21036.1 hypothetical protein SAMN04487938_3694 [Lysobacter sp. cf310]